MRSRLLAPGWLAMHVLVVVSVVAMVRLGAWQWGRGVDTGAVRNYSYGLEWWAFGVFTVGAWVKYCVDEVRPAPAAEPVPGPERAPAVPVPVVVVDDADDPELAAWNRRFAERAAREAERR